VGDFGGESRADILWRNTANGATRMWQMDGATVLANQGIGAASMSWLVTRLGDYDGGGKYDIQWRHTTTGANRLWLMDGFTVTANQAVTPVPPAWQIQ
ncbi:MAG: hypothetical protein OEU09_19015, partial [Rhodospirillales bacterium]|nr:hypothetical protein [Rhodospirillales bacterium]